MSNNDLSNKESSVKPDIPLNQDYIDSIAVYVDYIKAKNKKRYILGFDPACSNPRTRFLPIKLKEKKH